MFKNILLAVDGSTYSDTVIQYGIKFAKKFKSHLSVVTVADIRIFEWVSAVGTDGFVPIVPTSVYEQESRKLLDEKCEKINKKVSQWLQKEKCSFSAQKLVGSPTEHILEQSNLADLAIIGKRGEYERWDNSALGATVESVSRNIYKPLVVTKKDFIPIENILLAYDGSAHANKAMQYSGHIAETLKAKITIITVCEDQQVAEHYSREAEKYLNNYQISINHVNVSGSHGRQIVDYAEKSDQSLIAIGAYGHSRLKQALLGSTTDYILRHSKCPVLLAK